VEKLEKEIGSLESQKKSVWKQKCYFYQTHCFVFLVRLKMQMQWSHEKIKNYEPQSKN
jgi:hypothetical protein